MLSISYKFKSRSTFIQTLTDTVRADLWPGALVGLSWSLRGLPEDTRISGPGGHTTATQIEASLSQTDRIMKPHNSYKCALILKGYNTTIA